MIDKFYFNFRRKRILYDDLIDEWLKQQLLYVKESTSATYKSHIRNHLKPYFKNVFVDDIGSTQIQMFVNQKLKNGNVKDGKGLSIKSVKELVNIIRLSLQYAVSKNYIKEFTLNVKYPNITKGNKKILSSDEFIILKNYLKNNNNCISQGLLVMMHTGLRIGELCALKNEDVDLENGYLYINKTLQRISNQEKGTKIIISSVKSTKSNRVIPMPQSLLSELVVGNKALYFLTQKSSYIEPRTLRYKFKSIINKLHLTEVTVHSLRHYFATTCIELGFDYNCLSEILGHSSPSTTMNIYVHSKEEYKKECMNKITL